jgi:pimeloyl-ACP methyl ester carboxylesterase
MDTIRKALGEMKLNYYGLSYGTFLGMTYANLYPNNVGAFVIDGNVDPVAWTNLDCQVTQTNAIRSDQGAQDTLNEFILQCNEAQSGNCPLAPNAGERLDAVLEHLKTDPITLPVDGSQVELNYANMISVTLKALYSPVNFLALAELFVLLEASSPDPEAIIQVINSMNTLMHYLRTGYDNSVEGFIAVACSDSCSPTDYQAIFEAGKNATASYGYFGEEWNWGTASCASWTTPDADKYTGPFNAVTSTPVLVVGNLYDPATTYLNAMINNMLLHNSILLTVDTPGHTSLDVNECADAHVSEYLANPVAYAISRGDSVCKKERNFFDFLATPTDTSKRLGQFHKKIMEKSPRFPF